MADPIDTARSFVRDGAAPHQIDELLAIWGKERTTPQLVATQILFQSEYRYTYERELRERAACALIAFGDAGLDALVESIVTDGSLTTVTIGFMALGAVAHGDVELLRKACPAALLSNLETEIKKLPAEKRRSYILEAALRVKDEAVLMLAIANLATRAAFDSRWSMIITHIVAARTLAVSHATISQYRYELVVHASNEPALHSFLESNPTLLDPLAQSVWSKPSLDGQFVPDFVVRRRDDSYLVIEIETPGKSIVTSSVPLQISAAATHAVQQAVGYSDYLNKRAILMQNRFPNIAIVDALVVVGAEAALTTEQREVLRRDNMSRHGVRIVGFDWIADRAEAVLRSVTETLRITVT